MDRACINERIYRVSVQVRCRVPAVKFQPPLKPLIKSCVLLSSKVNTVDVGSVVPHTELLTLEHRLHQGKVYNCYQFYDDKPAIHKNPDLW